MFPQPPVNVTVYELLPATVGVPDIVTTLPDQTPDTPVGNPLYVAPVAPVVEYVIFVIALLMQGVCRSVAAAELNVMVLFALTVVVIVFELIGDGIPNLAFSAS